MKSDMIQVKLHINSNHSGKEAVFRLLKRVFVSGILESRPLVALLTELMEKKKKKNTYTYTYTYTLISRAGVFP